MKKIWVFGDYKQAESRVVAWRGPVPQMKQWFLEDKDIHIEIARSIGQVVQEHKLDLPGKLFRTIPWQLLSKENKDERQVGKTTGHAGNYGIGKNTLAIFLGMPPNYAEIILAIYHAKFPGIKQGYQRWIEAQIRRDRTIRLPPPINWEKTFYDLISEELFKAAYSFYPQSTIGALITSAIRSLGECFAEINFDNNNVIWTPNHIGSCGVDIKLNSHDAIGISVPDSQDLVKFTVKKMREFMEVPLDIEGEELIIPVDFKIGPSWGELKDYEEK